MDSNRKIKAKEKGIRYEADTSRFLSLWLSRGKRADIFWRSATSGGRSSVIRKFGEGDSIAGDICAVRKEGTKFLECFVIECKAYRSLEIEALFFHRKGLLVKTWGTLIVLADSLNKHPILFAKQNNRPELLGVRDSFLDSLQNIGFINELVRTEIPDLGIVVFDKSEFFKWFDVRTFRSYVKNYKPD